jgi:hypothetical protein
MEDGEGRLYLPALPRVEGTLYRRERLCRFDAAPFLLCHIGIV